jgi:hypothetical protein
MRPRAGRNLAGQHLDDDGTGEAGRPLRATEALPRAERRVALVLLRAVAHLLATAVGEVESGPAVGARAAAAHGERELVRANAVASLRDECKSRERCASSERPEASEPAAQRSSRAQYRYR